MVTGIAHLAFRRQAEGSLIPRDGKPTGSALIGQPFDDPEVLLEPGVRHFSRPYNGARVRASNLGPMNPALTDAIKDRVAALRAADATATGPVPIDPGHQLGQRAGSAHHAGRGRLPGELSGTDAVPLA